MTELPLVCIAEDRQSREPALRILVASLFRHTPQIRAHLFCPNATDSFREWLGSYPNARLNQFTLPGEWRKYDIKPWAMTTLLDAGHDDVLWVDSDILIAADLSEVFRGLDPQVIAVTEEAMVPGRVDNGLRARMWGFKAVRSFPFAVNTGVIRATSRHRASLQRWMDLLVSDTYRSAQALDWRQRPVHMWGDQDVFTALICSEAFQAFPIRILRRGEDIIQYMGLHGYTTGERLVHLRKGMPPFIHSQGYRPWRPRSTPRSIGDRVKAFYNELSPYTMAARQYRSQLADTAWLEPRGRMVKLFTAASANCPALVGAPVALATDAVRWIRRLCGGWKPPPAEPVGWKPPS